MQASRGLGPAPPSGATLSPQRGRDDRRTPQRRRSGLRPDAEPLDLSLDEASATPLGAAQLRHGAGCSVNDEERRARPLRGGRGRACALDDGAQATSPRTAPGRRRRVRRADRCAARVPDLGRRERGLRSRASHRRAPQAARARARLALTRRPPPAGGTRSPDVAARRQARRDLRHAHMACGGGVPGLEPPRPRRGRRAHGVPCANASRGPRAARHSPQHRRDHRPRRPRALPDPRARSRRAPPPDHRVARRRRPRRTLRRRAPHAGRTRLLRARRPGHDDLTAH